MTVTLRRADITCAEKIWEMQKVAFKDLLVKYQDFETNPANEPLDKVIMRLNQPFTYFYFIESDATIIGAIRVVDKKDGNEPKKFPLCLFFRNIEIKDMRRRQLSKLKKSTVPADGSLIRYCKKPATVICMRNWDI